MARLRAASSSPHAAGRPYYALHASARSKGLCPHSDNHQLRWWMCSLQKSPLTHFVAAPFQTGPAIAGLRFGSAAARRFCLIARKYRFYPSLPARRKRHIACDELFHFIAKLIARSFCCSSLPNRTRCRWAPVWGRRCAAVFSYRKEMSILTASFMTSVLIAFETLQEHSSFFIVFIQRW